MTSAPRPVAELQDHGAPDIPVDVTGSAAGGDTVMLGGDTVMLGGPDTVAADAGDTVFIDAGDTVGPADSRHDGGRGPAAHAPPLRHAPEQPRARPGAHRAPKPARRSRVVLWLGVAVFAVVASAAGLRWAQSNKPPRDEIITEMAEPPAPVAISAAATASEPVPMASEAVVASSAEAPASTPPGAGSVAVPAFVVASAPRPSARNAKRATPEPAAPVVVHEEPPPPPPPVVAEPKPRPAPPRVPSPQEACADANFLARPMCIHQECQKPSQANQPICVENRRRYEAEEQRRRQTPN